jgi:Protein of unknown function (DUF2637)
MGSMVHEPQHQKQPRTRWQAAGVAAIVGMTALIGLGLAAYSAAASYESVSGLAVTHHVPLPRLNPLGIDGGLFGVIVISVALIWMGVRIPWLRATARLFAVGTVAANAAAGWPDPVSVGLRVAAPVLFVVLMETVSAVLLHRGGEAEGIPLSRWLLDFRGTARLWRRMKLWRIRDYAQAVDVELSRLDAIEKLAEKFGPAWEEKVPGNVAWMLRAGVRMDDALKRVAELTAEPQGELRTVASGVTPAKRSRVTKGAKSTPRTGRQVRVPADVDTQAEALKILDAEPGISGRELGKRLGLDPSYGCRLKKKLGAPAPATGEQPRVSEES